VTGSLETGDAIAAEGAVAPRVTLGGMKGRVASEFYFTAGEAIRSTGGLGTDDTPASLDILTICVLVLDNGWTLLGKSAPASAANFDAQKGELFAYEDALRQLWPLEGYLLRDRLAAEQENG